MATNLITVMNLNANVGDRVVVTNGYFVVLPWIASGGSQLSSAQPVGTIAAGTYVIRDVRAESTEPGCKKSYSIERVSDEVMVPRDHAGQQFYDHKLAPQDPLSTSQGARNQPAAGARIEYGSPEF